jgi:hypothetical protein
MIVLHHLCALGDLHSTALSLRTLANSLEALDLFLTLFQSKVCGFSIATMCFLSILY